jgi:class 3 adenylate cyclase/tRNA A-37 threonylcarbamoyl transferase component Bud32
MTEVLASRYEVVATVSRGGQGEILKAIDLQHRRPVALKVYDVADDKRRREVLAEADVLLSLRPHIGLPVVRDDFFVDDRYVIVLDWIEGTSLDRVLAQHGDPGLPHSTVTDYVSQVATALDHLHRNNPPIVHGDVKPSNLVLTPAGAVILVDFGVAVFEGSRQIAGSLAYVAPEVVGGDPPSPASDVYGLAATTVTLLTGRPPDGVRPEWEGIDPSEIVTLARTLRRALSIDPRRRPPSAGELAARLRDGRRASLPTGVVTFLATELAGASELWDNHPDTMPGVCDRLDDIMSETVEVHGGRVIKFMGGGETSLSVFPDTGRAALAALAVHDRLGEDPWTGGIEITIRAALHTGESDLRDGEYYGPTAHRAARLCRIAPPTKTVVSEVTAGLLTARPSSAVQVVDLGRHRINMTPSSRSERVYGLGKVGAAGFKLNTPPPSVNSPPPDVWLIATDIEDSTRLLQESPSLYHAMINRYRRLLAEVGGRFGGSVATSADDTAVLVLPGPTQAVEAAVAAHRALTAADDGAPIRARLGVDFERASGPSASDSSFSTSTAVAVCVAGHGGQVLVSEAARQGLESFIPPGCSLVDLGLHRLSDLTQAQRLFQLTHPALERDFPPLRSLDNRLHNLPLQFTSFIGRRLELDQIAKLVGNNRLVTVTGPGGSGKTRLALQVGAEVLAAFPHGVWVADLSGVQDSEMLPSAIATAVGVREGGSGTYAPPGRLEERSATDRLIDQLEYRKALIILDNCEHIVASCAGLADRLLRQCRSVRIVATSREPLGLPGEAIYRVGPLDLPDPSASIEVLRWSPSVCLFADRATLRRPDLVLDDDATRLVASICRRLDGFRSQSNWRQRA